MNNISTYGLRVVKESTGRYDLLSNKINNPECAYDLFNKVLEMESRSEEIFAIATLDTKNKVNGVFVVSQGNLNSSIVHPREVFKRALLQNANSIMLCHNHPSGDATPSQEDISITKRLVESGKLLGIKVLDHIIIGNGGYLSLKEKGLM